LADQRHVGEQRPAVGDGLVGTDLKLLDELRGGSTVKTPVAARVRPPHTRLRPRLVFISTGGTATIAKIAADRGNTKDTKDTRTAYDTGYAVDATRADAPGPGGPDDYVLRDVSFEVRPGQRVGIVGATGSGKTTLINLLMRFYDVTRGRITIDGVDVRELDLDDLRGLFSLVLQDVHLFSGTIADNIRLGNGTVDDDRLHQAARAPRRRLHRAAAAWLRGSAVAERGRWPGPEAAAVRARAPGPAC
jgi:ABC-type multidrug transport system fused ATPase/permease subunit